MSWTDTTRMAVPELAAGLGLPGSVRQGYPCPVCQASSRGGGERRLPVTVTRSREGWVCRASGCGAQGGWLDYLSWSLHGGAYGTLSLDQARAVRAWVEERAGTVASAGPAGAVTPMAAIYPPDVALFWSRCRALSTGRTSAAWMASRGFGSRLGLLEAADLARLTPGRAEDYPDWWPAGRRQHWRLVVRAWDVRGELRSVHARAVGPAPEINGRPAPKQVWPKHPDPDHRFDAAGLFFACPRALALLRGEPCDARVLLPVEGLTDFLTAAGWAEERAAAGGVPVAVLGGVSGSWSALGELRDRLPAGLLVASALDRDEKGDGYHAVVERELQRAVPRLYFAVGADGRRSDVDDTVAQGGDLGALINSALRGEPRPGVQAEALAWWGANPDATSEEVGRVFDVRPELLRQWKARAARKGEVVTPAVTAPAPAVTGGGVTGLEAVTGPAVTAFEGGVTGSVTADRGVTPRAAPVTPAVTPTDCDNASTSSGCHTLADAGAVVAWLEAADRQRRADAIVAVLEDERLVGLLGEGWRENEARLLAGCERLRAVGYAARQVGRLESAAKAAARRLEAAKRWKTPPQVVTGGDGYVEERAGVEEVLGAILSPGVLPAGLVVPKGYTLGPGGVAELRFDPEAERSYAREIADAPLLVTGRLRDASTGRIDLQVSWYQRERGRGRWTSRTISRAKAADRRGVVELAEYGAPVNSGNAGEIVRYLMASETANEGALPCARVAGGLGWQLDGSFLLGRRLYLPGGVVRTVDPTAPASAWGEEHVQLEEDEGLAQLVGGYRLGGTWEGWRAAVRMVEQHPSVMLALYMTLIPPLFALVAEMPNFAGDWSGTTSQGKTSSLRLAASVWGVPDEHAVETVLHTWEKTRVWIEHAAAKRSGLPLILDDTKKAASRNAEDVQRVLFDVEGGQGRGRGSREGGLKASVSYRTVLLSSGEYPITTIGKTAHGGAVARVIELCGSPLGGQSKEAGDLAEILRCELLEHHGHAGDRLMRWLLAEDRAPELRRRYREYLLWWRAKAGDNAVAGRASAYLAAITIGHDLARDVLGVGACDGVLELAWQSVLRNVHRADVAATALQATLSWVVAQRHRFELNSGCGRHGPPAGGWLGVWDDSTGWSELGILGHELLRFLAEQGFEAPRAIARAWADRGWLRRSSKDHVLDRMSADSFRGRERAYYVVTRAAWNELMGEG